MTVAKADFSQHPSWRMRDRLEVITRCRVKTKQEIHVYLMGFSWNTPCFSLRTAHEFRRGNKIVLLVCGGDMEVLTPPTPSDSLCQALDLSQVQRARFQNGAPFCGTINSLSTSLAPTKTRKPRSPHQTSRWVCLVILFTLPTACKEHSQSFTLASLFFSTRYSLHCRLSVF